jgi:hypothetical protein
MLGPVRLQRFTSGDQGGELMMANRLTSRAPYVGKRVWLGGEITVIVHDIRGFERVTIKLDTYEHPVTIRWTEPDDSSLVVTDDS